VLKPLDSLKAKCIPSSNLGTSGCSLCEKTGEVSAKAKRSKMIFLMRCSALDFQCTQRFKLRGVFQDLVCMTYCRTICDCPDCRRSQVLRLRTLRGHAILTKRQYVMHTRIALIHKGFSDAINHPDFPSVVVRPGERYRHETRYVFLQI
jgi:hypothetical protein